MGNNFNLRDREVVVATRAQPEFERIYQLKARLRKDRHSYERLHLKRLEESGIMERRKESYGTYSVRRGPAWDDFFSEYGLRDTEEGLRHIESMEMFEEKFDRELGPMIHAAFNRNVLPFRRPPNAPIRS